MNERRMESPRLSRRQWLATAGCAALGRARGAANKRIAFVAGRKSHAFGQHAHNTGCLLLAKCMNDSVAGVEAVVHRDGWPEHASFFDGASAVVVFMDGGDRHPVLPHLDMLDRVMKRGAGLAVLHYALCVPKGEAGNKFLEWIGGYYETYWSVNPSWTARFERLPDHPVGRGVRPFAIFDEWYYHVRFRENMEGVTPILTAAPPDWTRERKFGPHSGNEVVRARKGMPEHLAWAYQRPEGGRGFGFSGGHFHWAWGHNDFRKVVLNGIAWVAGLEVPADGIPSRTPTWEEMLANQEGQMPEGFGQEQARQAIRPR